MKRKLKNVVKQLDFFSINIGFNIKQKDKYGTMLGGFTFVLYIIITCYFIIINFLTFIDRSIFNQNTIENKLSSSPKLDLLNPEMVYAFGLTIDRKVNLSYNYINVDLKHVSSYKTNKTKVSVPVKTTKCLKEHFNNLINETYDLLSLNDFFCIDKKIYEENFSMEGIYTSEVFQYLEFAAKANPKAFNDLPAFEKFFNTHDLQLQLYYLDTSINLSNYSSPSKQYLNSRFIQLSFPFAYKVNYDFSNNTFEDDANILVQNPEIFYYYTISNIEPTSAFLGFTRLTDKMYDWDLFGKMYIRSSQMTYTIKRTYQKFTEFLADATSIVSQFLFILMIILNAYNSFRANESIIDRIMRYKQKLSKKSPMAYISLKETFSSQITDQENLGHRDQPNYINTVQSSNNLIESSRRNTHKSRTELRRVISTKRVTFDTLVLKGNYHQNDQPTSSSQKYVKMLPIYSVFLPSKMRQCLIREPHKQFKDGYSLKYSLCDMIKSGLLKIGIKSSIKYKNLLFDKGMIYYMFNLDIFTYFTKMREIELLKYFLFTSHENNILAFLSKPSISSMSDDAETDTLVCDRVNEFEITNENIEKLADSFQLIYSDYKLNNKNRKLEKMLQQTSYEIHQLIQE